MRNLRRFVWFAAASAILFTGAGRTYASAPSDSDLAKAIRAARYEIKQHRFGSALDELKHLGKDDPSKDAEYLTVRAIAEWGQALTLYGKTEKPAGDYSITRLAIGLVEDRTSQYSAYSQAGKILAAARVAVAEELNHSRSAIASLPETYKIADGLFQSADNDLQAAAALAHRSKAEWCVNVEGWQLLAKAHRHVVWNERMEREKLATLAAHGKPVEPAMASPSEEQVKELEREIIAGIGRAVNRTDGTSPSEHVVHSAADALLLTSLTANKLDSWVHRARIRRVTRGQAKEQRTATNDKPRESDATDVSLDRISDVIRADPAKALAALYSRCARSSNTSCGPGPAYACYLLGVDSPEIGDMLDTAARLSPKDCAWVKLERAQTAIIEGITGEKAVQGIVEALGSRGMDRPILTSSPPPIREVFTRAPMASLMVNGPKFTGRFETITRLLRDASKSAPDDAVKAQYQALRLRVGILLTRSALPWDRWLGYSEAGSALSALGKVKGVFSEGQAAAFAASADRIQQDSVNEGFPTEGLYITKEGPSLWIRDPYTSGKTALVNPSVYIDPSGGSIFSLPR